MEENKKQQPRVNAIATIFTLNKDRDINGQTKPGSSIKGKADVHDIPEELIGRFGGVDLIVKDVSLEQVPQNFRAELQSKVDKRPTDYAKQIRDLRQKRRIENNFRS